MQFSDKKTFGTFVTTISANITMIFSTQFTGQIFLKNLILAYNILLSLLSLLDQLLFFLLLKILKERNPWINLRNFFQWTKEKLNSPKKIEKHFFYKQSNDFFLLFSLNFYAPRQKAVNKSQHVLHFKPWHWLWHCWLCSQNIIYM